MSMVELRTIQQSATSYIADPENLSPLQLKCLLPVVLTILQKNKEAQTDGLPRWEATLKTIQSRLPESRNFEKPHTALPSDCSLGELNNEFNRICNGSDTSTESSLLSASAHPLSKKEINSLIIIADRLASHYQGKKDLVSQQEYQKWKSVSVEVSRLQKKNGQWATAASRPFTSLFQNTKRTSPSELSTEGDCLIQRLPDQQKLVLYMQQKVDRMSLSAEETAKVHSFIVRVEESQSAEFILVDLGNGKNRLFGRSAEGKWFISEQNANPDPQIRALFDESLASDDVLGSLFQYISFKDQNSSNYRDYLAQGTSANVILLDVQSYTLENALNPDSESSKQRVAVKVFRAGWLEENGEQSILREWDDMQKLKGKASNTMQGHGTLLDSSGKVRAIILPYFRGELGGYIQACPEQDLYERALPLLCSIAGSLKEMHEADFCHNDIKLSNILVQYEERDGQVLFSDYAIADLQNLSVKEGEDIKPTSDYCFREELEAVNDRSIVSSEKDRLDLRKRMDVRALGVTLYKIFARDENATPYPLESDPFLMNQCMDSNEGYHPLPSIVPESIKMLVKSMLSVDLETVPSMKQVYDILTCIDVSKVVKETVRKKEIMEVMGI